MVIEKPVVVAPTPEPVIVEYQEIKRVREKVVFNINPIYFNLDKAELTSSSQLELDKVAQLMIKYPNAKIEVGSHTDSRGSKSYNLELSSQRANSVVDYITKHGISNSRIKAVGYGESQPVNHCIDGEKCNEQEYKMNRRTEFVILNPDVLGY